MASRPGFNFTRKTPQLLSLLLKCNYLFNVGNEPILSAIGGNYSVTSWQLRVADSFVVWLDINVYYNLYYYHGRCTIGVIQTVFSLPLSAWRHLTSKMRCPCCLKSQQGKSRNLVFLIFDQSNPSPRYATSYHEVTIKNDNVGLLTACLPTSDNALDAVLILTTTFATTFIHRFSVSVLAS